MFLEGMIMDLSYYFILYIIYSMIGWCIEVIDTLIESKKFVNRGFMIGPYCPIYGKGALLVILLLKNYLDQPLVLFIISMVICSIVEYFGSLILEKLFNTRWWDYTHKKFNINGRICLENIIPFGLGCLAVVYIIQPLLSHYILLIPTHVRNIIAIILLILYFIDFLISFKIIWKFKSLSTQIRKDSTEKVTDYVKNTILAKNKILYKRIINAFPKFEVLKKIKIKKHEKK